MALPTGLAAQLGVGEESTWGTGVTVDRFFEFNTESMKQEIDRLESAGLRAGTRVLRSDRWVAGSKTVSGDIEMELNSKNQGILFKHAFGNSASALAGTTAYEHTFDPGDLPIGLTVQIGRPDSTGTVRPFSYPGSKVASWEVSGSVDEIAMARFSLVGQDEDTVTALATASYVTGDEVLVFTGGYLEIASTEVKVTAASISGDNGLAVDRRNLGDAKIALPLEAQYREYGGDMTARFTSLTDYNRFVNGTEAALVLKFEGSNIETTYDAGYVFTCNVRFDGETPEVSGPEELMQPLSFKCVDDGTGPDSAITLVYTSTDTTV